MSSFLSLLFTSPSVSGSGSAANSATSNNASGSQQNTGNRQCWICFAEEPLGDEDAASTGRSEQRWVQPCRCRGTSGWVHQACLLDWLDVKQRGAGMAGIAQAATCPQCHHQYRVEEARWALPASVLRSCGWWGRMEERVLMWGALAGVGLWGYGTMWGYGAGALGAALGGPWQLSTFLHRHAVAWNAGSLIRVWLGIPLITVGVLSLPFPSFSWCFPLLPPILYANDVIEWSWPPSDKLTCLLLPVGLFVYRWAERRVADYAQAGINMLTGAPEPSEPDDEPLLPVQTATSAGAPSLGSPGHTPLTAQTDESMTASMILEDDRAIRISILATTAALMLPFAGASLGWLLARRLTALGRLSALHRMLIGGALLIGVRDIIRSLTWYQRVAIRPFRRILPYQASK